jgi:hypothetical protein
MTLEEVQAIVDEAREFAKTSQYADLSYNPKDIMSKLYGVAMAYVASLTPDEPDEPVEEA